MPASSLRPSAPILLTVGFQAGKMEVVLTSAKARYSQQSVRFNAYFHSP
jgi:hypothetical protein